MNELIQFFEKDGYNIHALPLQGEPWFVAVDVCAALGLSNPSVALQSLDDDEKLPYALLRSGQSRTVNIISESGFYALVFKSRKEGAKRFRKWVTSEVIPAIRKTGKYEMEDTKPAIPQTLGEALRLAADLSDKLEREKQENQMQRLEIQEMTPKAAFHDRVMDSETLFGFREASKRLGVKMKDMIDRLRVIGAIYKGGAGRDWLPAAYLVNMGYAKTVPYEYRNSEGKPRTRNGMKWTERGINQYLRGQMLRAGLILPETDENKMQG